MGGCGRALGGWVGGGWAGAQCGWQGSSDKPWKGTVPVDLTWWLQLHLPTWLSVLHSSSASSGLSQQDEGCAEVPSQVSGQRAGLQPRRQALHADNRPGWVAAVVVRVIWLFGGERGRLPACLPG